MREYYIRREGDEDSSGPFDLDQISSLMEAKKLDPEAYYYEIESESWEKISSNQEMMDTLFPKKKKLSLRSSAPQEPTSKKDKKAQKAKDKKAKEASAAEASTKDGDDADAEPKESDAPAEEEEPPAVPEAKEEPREKLDVPSMLAVAEGRANDKSGRSPREKQAAVAFYGLRALTLYFIASILAMAYIKQDLVLSANAIEMAKSPFLVIAAFDILIVATLLLQVTEIYPLLRFRAAIGAGFLSLIFYASGDWILLIANLLLMTAVYFSSAIIKIRYLIACTIAGLAGIFGYAYAFFLA